MGEIIREMVRYKEQIAIPGINLFLHDHHTFIVSSDIPLYTIGSAVIGGGIGSARHIINHTVDKEYQSGNPGRDLRRVVSRLHLSPDVAGMMTAVSVTNTFICCRNQGDLTVAALCTAGTGNPGVAGMPVSDGRIKVRQPGTINIILLVDGNLTGAAMVNAVMTATEAKTRALIRTNILLPGGEQVTGTTTDAMVVACTGRGEELLYAGTGTELGSLIGHTVFESLCRGIDAYCDFNANHKK